MELEMAIDTHEKKGKNKSGRDRISIYRKYSFGPTLHVLELFFFVEDLAGCFCGRVVCHFFTLHEHTLFTTATGNLLILIYVKKIRCIYIFVCVWRYMSSAVDMPRILAGRSFVGSNQ